MKVLLLKDIIIAFLTDEIANAEHRTLLTKLLMNEGTRFLHSKKFFEFIKEGVPEESYPEFMALVTRFSDSGGNVDSDSTAVELTDELKSMIGRLAGKPLISISHSPASQEITEIIPNVAALTRHNKPNFDWLAIQLAINHPNMVHVNVFDFQSEAEIKKFFGSIFNLSRNLTQVHIFDRETAFFNHGKLDRLKKGVSVTYCTLHHPNYYTEEANIRDFFKNLRIFKTNDRNLNHSRKIIFDNFVTTSDNALNNLYPDGDWLITIHYCEDDARKWISKLSRYTRCYPA